MSYCKMILVLLLLGILWTAKPVMAESFTIVTPYFGIEDNTFTDPTYEIELKDSEPMKGFYIQSVNPEKYQWNFFLYQTKHINASDLWGFNFTYDYYFGIREQSKYVAGVGMNYLNMELAGKNILTKWGTLDALTMDLSVSSFYLRLGRYFEFGDDKLRSTVLPWIGGEMDRTRGDGVADFPGPRFASFKTDDDETSLLAGLNLKFTFNHFLQAEVKHSIAFTDDDFFNRSVAMVNLFVTRNWGFSYRFNRQETVMGTDEYSMFGVAVIF